MKYICQICGYIYDEAKEKIPFQDLPDDWKCPLCGAPKSEFKPESKPEPVFEASEPVSETPDLQKLSAGQLSALCSNLARGCEKQYKEKDAHLFKELADYFSAITPREEDATVENLARMLLEDVNAYPNMRKTADADFDRGAARICVWGEKVTRMLSSLVKRYLEEGEQMLSDTEIWVCSTCGFVYIGVQPPELCPVCKVPSWKFEKIERRIAV